MQNFKHVRSPYSGDFFLENYHTKRALNTMCLIYVPHKLHKVLALVDKNTCANYQRPTTAEFEAMIYNNYLQLLDRLVMYQGQFGGVVSILYVFILSLCLIQLFLRFLVHFLNPLIMPLAK